MPNAPKDAPVKRVHLAWARGICERHGGNPYVEVAIATALENAERAVRAAIIERLRALQAKDEIWSLELRQFVDEMEAANRG